MSAPSLIKPISYVNVRPVFLRFNKKNDSASLTILILALQFSCVSQLLKLTVNLEKLQTVIQLVNRKATSTLLKLAVTSKAPKGYTW